MLEGSDTIRIVNKTMIKRNKEQSNKRLKPSVHYFVYRRSH